MDITTLRSIITVLMFVTFIGVWIWAWSSKRREDFDEAANLPFVEDGIADHTGAQKDSKKDIGHE